MKGRLEAQKHRQVWRRYEKLQPKIHVTNKSQRQSTLYFEKFGIGVSVLLSGHLSNKLSSTALSPIPRLNFSEIIHLVYAVKGVLHAFDGHMFARPQYLTGELWRFLPWRIVGISLMIWYKYIDIYKLYMFLKLFSPSVGFANKSCCGYWVFAALGYPLPTLTYLVRPSGIPAPSIKKDDRIFGNASQFPTRCSMSHQVDQVFQVESAWGIYITNIWFLV